MKGGECPSPGARNGTLDGPMGPSESATQSLPPAGDEQPSVHVGDVLLGRYRVERILGAGGMGVVVAVTHIELGTHLALKLIRPDRQRHALAVDRFFREARAATRVGGEHIAQVMDVGMLETGAPYMIMEHLVGRDLGEELQARGPLPTEEAVEIVLQACVAVAAAHAAGIVHRDLKPKNLFLTRRPDGSPLVKVLDFGIAKALDDESGGSLEALTVSGAVLGSPMYMSPEQIKSASDVDHRTDVWSLGVILYELLSGCLPFGGSSVAARLARIVADAPVPLRQARPDVPAKLDAQVMRCIEKDVARRTPSVAALAQGIAPFAPSRTSDSVARLLLSVGPTLAETPQKGARALRLSGPGARAGAWFAALAVAALSVAAAVAFARALAHRSAVVAPATGSATSRPDVRRFAPRSARRITFDEGAEEFPSWTPDGRMVAYDGKSGPDTHIFLLDPDTGVRRLVTREPGAQITPAISPLGKELAYLQISTGEQAAYAVALDGTRRRRLSPLGTVRPSWSPDGRFVWVGIGSRPQRIDAETLSPSRELRSPDDALVLHVRELPDGRVVALAISPVHKDVIVGIVLFGASDERGSWLWRADMEEVLELSPDGESVLASKTNPNQTVDLWRVPLDGSPPEPVARSDVLPRKGLRIAPDGRRVAWSNGRDAYDLAYLTSGRDPAALLARPHGGASDWRDDEPHLIPGTSSLLVMSTRTGTLRPCVLDTSEREPARCLDPGGVEASGASPSPDGRSLAFSAAGKGVFVAPLDGSAPPRRATEAGDGEIHVYPTFAPDGKEVYFDVVAKGVAHIEAIPFAGGARRRVFEDGSRRISFSPRGDTAALFLDTQGVRASPVLVDLATKKRRPLAAELADSIYSRRVGIVWNANGARVALVRGPGNLVEVDVVSGRVARHFEGSEISGVTYVGEDPLISRVEEIGDIWIADL
jgi:serine/threonine-protein kinase